MEAMFTLFIVVIVLIFAGIGLYYLVNVSQDTLTRQAKVVSKRMSFSQGQNSVSTHYHCLFEFEDGQREEYSVGERPYGLIAEGDRGELDTKGWLFWDFRPRNERPAQHELTADFGREPEPVVKVRCRQCQQLNDETARFCNRCGAAI